MQNNHEHLGSPLDRLARDMNSLGRDREPAADRLAAELGDDLLAAITAELDRLDSGAFPVCSRPRRVA